jgi:hypothetical protein
MQIPLYIKKCKLDFGRCLQSTFFGKFLHHGKIKESLMQSVKMVFWGKNVHNSPYFMGKKSEITIFRQH